MRKIGELLGYSRLSTFHATFERRFSVTPRKYRRQKHQEAPPVEERNDEHLSLPFWRRALLGEADPKKVARLHRVLQERCPDIFLSASDTESPAYSRPWKVVVDGREFERIKAD